MNWKDIHRFAKDLEKYSSPPYRETLAHAFSCRRLDTCPHEFCTLSCKDYEPREDKEN